MKDDNLRHVLVAMVENALTAARWNNQAQGFVESIGLGIPINISSDPRHLPAGTSGDPGYHKRKSGTLRPAALPDAKKHGNR
ncbi:hypothetical protein FACS189479_06240 [Spirochaetia bacterium]|nr:hypothetical protein FACS189479_06240 [Spirochaetia bacterium]